VCELLETSFLEFVNLITIHNSRDGSGAMVDLVFAFCRRSQSRICDDQSNDITVINAICL
jgi:hypothetical protein